MTRVRGDQPAVAMACKSYWDELVGKWAGWVIRMGGFYGGGQKVMKDLVSMKRMDVKINLRTALQHYCAHNSLFEAYNI
jgi:hypothetical protein